MKNKHRIKQGLSLLLAGGIALTNLGAVMPAFAEDAPATPENAEAVTPETAEADTTAPNLVQITENLYNDLPDAPTGSYLGNMGLPVAIGETKIGISAWVSDLYDGVDAHMDADALNADENTVTIGKTPGTDYAIVPLLAQVEYPADGAVSEIILPDGVELLSYRSTDYEPIPADEQEQAEILHQTYSEQSAAATGLYVKASADFTAQLVYTCKLLDRYIRSFHSDSQSQMIPLFYNAKKQALSRYGVTYILKKYAAKASPVLEPQNISPHVLRHTKAMHLLRAGVNMIYIRDFLGHADISTTEVYARIDAEMKRKVFEEKVPNYTPNTTMPWEEDEDLLQWLTQFGKKTF